MNVLDTEWSVRNCTQCPNDLHCTTDDISNLDQCLVQECNNTCFLSNMYNHTTSNEQCYRSYCASNIEIDPHRVVIQGILYLNRSQPVVELWEISIPCHGVDCSRWKIFPEVSAKIKLYKIYVKLILNIFRL